ncbi:Glyceraldehyde 3-phosphate phosphatase [uncultured archaeon]|nr:Glyceraldehyde 3-phosphate phosphatase [uncultured archaeon]
MVSFIFFDIDDTLFPSTEFSELARRNAIHAIVRMGLECGEGDVEKMLEEVIKERGSNYPHHFDEALKRLGVKNRAKYVAAAVAAYHDTKIAILPYPEVPAMLAALKQAGAKLYIASEGLEVKQWDKLIRMHLEYYFDEVFVSEKGELGKSPEFYRQIAKRAGARPEDCLMAGDREDKDILPAKKAGMLTFRVFRGKYAVKPRTTAADFNGKDLRQIVKIVKKLS